MLGKRDTRGGVPDTRRSTESEQKVVQSIVIGHGYSARNAVKGGATES